MTTGRQLLFGLALFGAAVVPAAGLDPPHEFAPQSCGACHITHAAPGGTLTSVQGNFNLCASCHVVGGQASALPFSAVDDPALPGPGLPAGFSPRGNSHRWDSSSSGHTQPDPANTSTGTIRSGGTFTGRFSKTYILIIASAGQAGVATFSYTDTLGGSGFGTTGADVALDEGVTVTFTDGVGSPSFKLGEVWRIFVRTDLREPIVPSMLARLEAGKLMCSTCHNQHSQSKTPFTPWGIPAPPYNGSGSGAGRLFQREDGDTDQTCKDCHSARDVNSSTFGSHPVGSDTRFACVTCHDGGSYIPDPLLTPPGPQMTVECSTCHEVHYAATSDGTLVRLANTNTLCTNCHQLANTVAGSHFDAATGVLWPGGQYGSTFPPVADSAKTGYCTNCHQPHGWPDADNSFVTDYPLLQVDREEKQCFTCHDGSPLSANIRFEFTDASKISVHPLALAEDVHAPGEAAIPLNRHVECADCHDPHLAEGRIDLPGPATTPRAASGPLTGVQGVNLGGTAVRLAAFEYEVCFRCHSTTATASPPTPRQFPETNLQVEFSGGGDFRKSFHSVAVDNTASHPVPSLRAGWSVNSKTACTACHNNDSGPANGGGAPNGPHGSIWPNLLENRFDTDQGNYSQARYSLCFECHDPAVILDDTVSFKEHDKHINGEKMSCNYCHDPHGSSAQRFLINFDASVALPSGGRLEFEAPEDSSDGRGRCWVDCHLPDGTNKDHKPKKYDPNYPVN